MISLEQVKLLESKVAKAVDYVKRVTGENRRLEGTLESYRKRIEELEVLIQQFKEDQGKIEDGILSALDRLNQFEDAIEKSLSRGEAEAAGSKPAPAPQEPPPPAAPVPQAAPPKEIFDEPEPEDPEEEADLGLDEGEEPADGEEDEKNSGEAELDIY